MGRYFNTEGVCNPNKHYMVRLDERLIRIKEQYVDRGSYFVINRGRQYGKTTTLRALAEYLKTDYIVVSLDFQKIGTEGFRSETAFSRAFLRMFTDKLASRGTENGKTMPADIGKFTDNPESVTMSELFEYISGVCSAVAKPLVLIIDEVDSASNNQVFIDFLAMLRGYYIDRDNKPTFQSVILAGVYDIKNLKLKIRPDVEHKYNSPWNIAARFNIKMSFDARQIAGMLGEYEDDNHTGMDICDIAGYIYDYTSGYPYLVSAICKLIDEEICGTDGFGCMADAWTRAGVDYAVKVILNMRTPLFGSMIRQLHEYPELKQMLHGVLFAGKRISYNIDNPVIDLAVMFGYVTNINGSVQVSNRMFEMCLYNYFLSEEECTNELYDKAQGNIGRFIHGGKLDMDMVMDKFVSYFTEIYGDNDEKFIESYGRKLFLLYLKPIINGTGNYYIEARTRDSRRTDVIVDYLGEQFIIELKIWHGNEYNERGEEQLAGYLDYYHKDVGYMISFNFNKNKQVGVRRIQIGDRTIVEAVV